MIRYGIIATILILFTTALSVTFREGESDADAVEFGPQDPIANEQDALRELLAAMESELNAERARRIQLESTLATLREEGSQNEGSSSGAGTEESPAPLAPNVSNNIQNLPDPTGPQPDSPLANANARQIQRLIDAGFDSRRASEIVRFSEELQMQFLSAQYAASLGEPVDGNIQFELAEQFKEGLGEADFEKYLLANRQPTSVVINNVFASSPAHAAGLQAGDEIIRYGGTRVYNILELNRLTQTTSSSNHVEVEVLRNGRPVLISMPTGPMGISSGSRPGVLSSERGF